jgi:hypothetical protein
LGLRSPITWNACHIPAQIDLDAATVDSLAAYAHKAFVLGYLDGTVRPKPHDSHHVMGALFPDGWKGRVIHRLKFRQVYGAGFDMAQALKRVKESETITGETS